MWGTLANFLKSFCWSPVQKFGSFLVKKALPGLTKKLGKNGWERLGKLLNAAFLVQIIIEIGKKILGFLGVAGAVTSGGATIAQVTKLLESIGDPQTALLDYIHSVMIHAPYSIQSLLASVDSTLASMTSVFNPPITLTYILQVTAVGECFNQLLMSAVQNAVFIFSVFLVRWAFKSNFTFTYSGKLGKPSS